MFNDDYEEDENGWRFLTNMDASCKENVLRALHESSTTHAVWKDTPSPRTTKYSYNDGCGSIWAKPYSNLSSFWRAYDKLSNP